MLRAYFDTNVYSALADNDTRISPGERQALLRAATSGALVAPVSLAALDETVGQLETDRPAVIRKLAMIRGLNGFRGMLKQPSDILKEAIEAYGVGAEAPPVILPENERRKVVRFLADVIAGSTRHDADLAAIVRGVGDRHRGLKGSWFADMLGAQRDSLADPVMPSLKKRQRVTFEQFFAYGAEDAAEGFAKFLGCDAACRARGLDGLIRVPAMRLCVGVSHSQIYSQVIGTPGQPDLRRPDAGDGYDVWHAILATTAEVFLTLDGRLADHAEGVPDVAFRVVRSAGGLLDLLGRASPP